MKTDFCISASRRLGGPKSSLLTNEGLHFSSPPGLRRGGRFGRGGRLTGWFSLVLFLFSSVTFAQTVPAPKDTLGFTPGDDRKLASWAQIVDYFQKLDKASDRMILEEIGKTTMGAPFVYATISSPANLQQLKKYEEINAKLADPRKLGTQTGARDAAAKKLIAQGKTIVLITHGIHSTEVGSTLSSMLIAHRLASSNEPEIKKILDNTIILIVPSLNPDGVDIVKNWYDKTLGTPYEGTSPPELYHKYVGHDNNRDWYAFTQVETQLTVDKIHNVWHPQIVHDIHQQGANGSRLFLPPYIQPVEPNVPKQIVEGYTELGTYMAETMRKAGYQGITTNSTYDAWTPARAYSHYHGGVRILSETASARLATPVTVKFDDLRVPADDGYDPKVESSNFGPVWLGGEWRLRNITDYMTTAAFSLLNHAADNRERWLTRFYQIGKEAVRPRKDGELVAFAIKNADLDEGLPQILDRSGVEMKVTAITNFTKDDLDIVVLVKMAQPYGAFAKALLEKQVYPDLKDNQGVPITPYDVTAHSLSLLFHQDVVPVFRKVRERHDWGRSGPSYPGCAGTIEGPKVNNVRIYRSEIPSMDEGWTRHVTENSRHWFDYGSQCEKLNSTVIRNSQIRNIQFSKQSSSIIFPDQPAAQILNGYAKGTMPDEYTGGVGKEGVENLTKFVEAGGTLVFLNRSSEFAIEQFNLPIRNVVKGLDRKAFYIPGSILRTELDLTSPIAKGMPQQSIAWFENSPAFEIETTDGRQETGGKPQSPVSGLSSTVSGIKVIATYPKNSKDILLSGWALGADKIAGKAALVEITMGKGKIILFGFRPQYRGQSLATFPLLFNAISQ
ncbi:MAG: M14 family metallopeptidase [Blastocatellia bacterium]